MPGHGGNEPKTFGILADCGQAYFSSFPSVDILYTQSNITNIIFTWVHNTNTEKIMGFLNRTIRNTCLTPKNEVQYYHVPVPYMEKLNVLPEFEHLHYMVAIVMCPVSPKIHVSRDHTKFIVIASSSYSG